MKYLAYLLFNFHFVFSLSEAFAQNDAPQFLGILEESGRSSWNGVPGSQRQASYTRKVRTVFVEKGANWDAMPTEIPSMASCQKECDLRHHCSQKDFCATAKCQNDTVKNCGECFDMCSSWTEEDLFKGYPSQLNWTIAFDGKKLGEVSAKTIKFPIHDPGAQEIINPGKVPTVGKRSIDYGGFIGDAVHRPLVANTKNFFTDPDQWKMTKPSSELTKRYRQEFRKKFPKVENCKNPDEDILASWKYREKDMKIVKAYRAKDGRSLAEIKLSEYRCDGPIGSGSPFDTHWFTLDLKGQSTDLDSGIWLVDAGDYDSDGKSELIFAIDRYNEGGYELFYDDFQKRAVFQFGYH